MSSFLKSIDPNHLVSVGDEGFFANGTAAGYDGSEGVDHAALLAVSHIDFGTFHLYPETWGYRVSWSSRWIEDHIEAARAAGKPTVLEEYGIIARRGPSGAVVDDEPRRKAYTRWHDIVAKRGGGAALFWMLAGIDDGSDAQNGMYPDYDHFEIYKTDVLAKLIKAFASTMVTDSQACKSYRDRAAAGAPTRSPFVSVSPPPAIAPLADDQPLDVRIGAVAGSGTFSVFY